MIRGKIHVNNAPKNGTGFMVARVIDSQLWYFGLFDDEDRAKLAAEEVEGIYFEVTENE